MFEGGMQSLPEMSACAEVRGSPAMASTPLLQNVRRDRVIAAPSGLSEVTVPPPAAQNLTASTTHPLVENCYLLLYQVYIWSVPRLATLNQESSPLAADRLLDCSPVRLYPESRIGRFIPCRTVFPCKPRQPCTGSLRSKALLVRDGSPVDQDVSRRRGNVLGGQRAFPSRQ